MKKLGLMREHFSDHLLKTHLHLILLRKVKPKYGHDTSVAKATQLLSNKKEPGGTLNVSSSL